MQHLSNPPMTSQQLCHFCEFYKSQSKSKLCGDTYAVILRAGTDQMRSTTNTTKTTSEVLCLLFHARLIDYVLEMYWNEPEHTGNVLECTGTYPVKCIGMSWNTVKCTGVSVCLCLPYRTVYYVSPRFLCA